MSSEQRKTNEVQVKQKGGAVTNINIEQFADSGFDNVDSKSLALPFLKVLGQLSPQVTQGDSQFIQPELCRYHLMVQKGSQLCLAITS